MMKEFEDLFEYNNDFDESIFEIRYTNSKSNKSARILKQIKICDNNMNWYNTGYDYEPVLKNYIYWGERHKNVGISFVFPFVFIVDIINFFINYENYPEGLILNNSIKSNQSQGKPDIWKLEETDIVHQNKKLYHFTITRGGNQDFNVDMYLNLHTIRCIIKTLKNYYLSEKTKRIASNVEKKFIPNTNNNSLKSLKDFNEFVENGKVNRMKLVEYLDRGDGFKFTKWLLQSNKYSGNIETVKYSLMSEPIEKLENWRKEYLKN